MTDYRWFGSKSTITVDGSTITGIKEYSIIPRFDFVEDYDNESVFLGEVARIKGRVEFKVKFGKWDPTVTGWMFKILNPAGADGTMADTNEVAKFPVVCEVHPYGAPLVSLIATLTDVRFQDLPFNGVLDTWNPMELTGIGTSVAFTNA
jgi:hypothetical protein